MKVNEFQSQLVVARVAAGPRFEMVKVWPVLVGTPNETKGSETNKSVFAAEGIQSCPEPASQTVSAIAEDEVSSADLTCWGDQAG